MKISSVLAMMAPVLTLQGCTDGLIGMMRHSGERVEMNFEDSGFGHGKLTATLPDGELFEGKFVEVIGSAQDSLWTATSDYGVFTVTSYTGDIEGMLFGDRQHTICYRFRTAGLGIPSGAVGQCEISDGHVIDMQF